MVPVLGRPAGAAIEEEPVTAAERYLWLYLGELVNLDVILLGESRDEAQHRQQADRNNADESTFSHCVKLPNPLGDGMSVPCIVGWQSVQRV